MAKKAPGGAKRGKIFTRGCSKDKAREAPGEKNWRGPLLGGEAQSLRFSHSEEIKYL